MTPPEFYQIPTQHRVYLRQAFDHVVGQGYRITQQKILTEVIHYSIPAPTVRNVCRWFKAGLLDGIDWEQSPQAESASQPKEVQIPLVQAIRDAKTYDDLKELGMLVAEELARNHVTSTEAVAFKGLLAEARQALKAQMSVEPDAIEEAIVLVSEPAAQMAKTYEFIVSDERRQACQDFVENQFQEDLVENPNRDTIPA